MKEPPQRPRGVRFGVFEVDLRSGELCRQGVKVKLQEQPFQVLAILLEHAGEVVTREELRQRLWTQDTFVDFEHGLATAINKAREALGDAAQNPRFIETLPKRGYRFIAPVEPLPSGTSPPAGRGARTEQAAVAAVYDRRAESADALEAGPSPARPGHPMWAHLSRPRLVATITGAFVVTLAILVAFNVGGLRQRMVSSAGSHHGPPLPRIGSIAVLPLENLSHDPAQDYFADGMTEELITDLGKISALRIISRQSVMRYKGSKKPLPEIARELNVDAIVEGAVRRSGDHVRITANLLYAPSDRHLWAATYKRNLGDVLSLQDEVAQAIARQIRMKLTPQEHARLANPQPVDRRAYDLYLKGRYEGDRISNAGLNKGLEYFQEAIRLDPSFAPAYSGIADIYLTLGIDGFAKGTVVYPKAKAAALRALQIDETLAEAHASMGFALFNYEHDYGSGIKELETATRLNPNCVKAHLWYALSLAWLGRSEEALRQLEQARGLDPLSARINLNFVYVFYLRRQYDRAIAEGHKALEVEPDYAWTYGFLGRVYYENGMPREALAAFERRLALQPDFPKAEADVAVGYAAVGNRGEALKILGKLRRQAKHEYVTPYPMARAYVALGQKEEALTWLRKGLDLNDGDMQQLYVDPALDPLRSDPRFQALLHRMNFPQ